MFYLGLLGSLVGVAVVVEYLHGQHANALARHEGAVLLPLSFIAFRNNYLFVYSQAMAGDWMQGPYIYALYEHYGYKVGDIGRLFIAGFGSSMVFGTLVGALADKYGRRSAALLYVVTYSLSCLTKHSADYWVLMFGRLLGGISTSLLFTAFESWLVSEHVTRGYPESLLGNVFSKATFLGAGLMAIISGLVGNMLVEDMQLGIVAPFDASIAVMVLAGAVIMGTWSENYGKTTHRSLGAQFSEALQAICADQRIALLGAMQSFFEASMYTFVFLWTPALSPNGEKLPHGVVFSCFMTACMAGSALTGLLIRKYKPQDYMALVYFLSAASLALPFVFHLEQSAHHTGTLDPATAQADLRGGITLVGKIELLSFCVFECCVGIFWPTQMTLRAAFVPEELRSTILNIFRIPLNLFVCLVLYKVSSVPLSAMFGLCVLLLLGCVLCQMRLSTLIKRGHASKSLF